MQYINVRQLLSNFKEATSKLPVTITRYGKPLFTIVHIDSVGISSEHFTNPKENIQIIKDALEPELPEKNSKKIPKDYQKHVEIQKEWESKEFPKSDETPKFELGDDRAKYSAGK